MSWRLDVTVDGERVVVEVASARHRVDIANVVVASERSLRIFGRIDTRTEIHAVGRHIAALPAKASGAVLFEVVPFGEGHVDPAFAATFLRYEAMIARRVANPGLRGALTPSRVEVALAYPGWRSVPASDRAKFIRMVATTVGARQLRINGRVAVEQKGVRRWLGRPPIVHLDA